ncbi:hypothetical protein BCON_0448g00050 [Botryotinia convoluta]|uniref:Fe2OG dioxygenase domain-containing protein n=1 Tax=Botryotinia convoluta TaxID=54673 RepID=A0A4Z1H766_9HELO|nr:hypothetical protein BCON_0448g00050 [Botryotinia convoluta]
MPTSKYFNQYPEFPADLNVASIPSISFNRLKNNVNEESEKLFQACQEYGFFLLELRNGDQGETLLGDAEKMFDITTSTLTIDHEVLKEYKAPGVLKTDDRKLDNIAMYSLGQDDILGTSSPCANPLPIETHREECKLSFYHAHGVLNVILAHLEKYLGLAPGTLVSLNSLDKESDTSLRMLLSRPQSSTQDHQITLGGHTDIGTITMLFNIAGGLQILPSAENRNENWQYIRPVPGCALTNIGDTMVEWTGGILRSLLHRAVTAPGEQAGVTRQSLAYLVRSEKNASMKRLESKEVIPRLEEGEQEEERSVSEWSAWRAMQIIKGELKPGTRGGRMVGKLNGGVKV